MTEVWKDIEGYEGLYQVSNFGRVKSLWGRYNKDGVKMIKQMHPLIRNKRTKYFVVGLTDSSGKQYPHLVHRLVARAFPEICGEWFDGCEIHHKDLNPDNNHASNIVVLSKEEHNRIHQESDVTKQRRFDGQRNRPDCSKVIVQYTLNMEYVDEYPSTMEAQRKTGLNRHNISRCANGYQKYSQGYIWRYKI